LSITLSRRQIKSCDRVRGGLLLLPWPAMLPPPAGTAADDRPASAAEHAVARRLVADACAAADLIHTETWVVVRRRPSTVVRPYAVEPHLAPVLVGRRWVGAAGRHVPIEIWPSP